MPPIIAILLALFTKEVYLSLFAGCALGALLVAEFHPWVAFDTLFNTMIDSVDFSILMFMILLGMVVMLMQESGGTRAYGEWAAKKLKSKRATLVATSLLGALIFVDDYFNCLTVGSVMRPVTDSHKISRPKLAYLIDATAAPVCMIAPISSWAAAVSSTAEGLDTGMSGIELFVKAIPYNLYSILTFVFILAIIAMKLDYGPMRKFEAKAAKGDLSALVEEAGESANPNGRVIDLILPVLALIVTCTIGMIYVGGFFGADMSGDPSFAGDFIGAFGNTNAFVGLPWGGIIALVLTVIYLVARKVLTFKEAMACVPKGFIAMVPPIIILTLAVSLKAMINSLGADVYVHDLMFAASMSLYSMLPAVIFVVACILAFASGTSWGTFGILLPIVTYVFDPSSSLFIIGVSACLAGAVFGDHCSPISDTTIASALTQDAEVRDVVRTRLPYSLIAGVISAVLFIIVGIKTSTSVTLPDVIDPAYAKTLVMLVIPVIMIILMLRGWNLISTLIVCDLVGFVLCLVFGFLDVPTLFSATGPIGAGLTGMLNVICFSFFMFALLEMLKRSGVFDMLLEKLNNASKTPRQAELVTILLSVIGSGAIAAAPISILFVGPVVRKLLQTHNIERTRGSNLMDGIATGLAGIVPYNPVGLNAVSLAIASGVVSESFSFLDYVPYNFHSWLLILLFLLSAITGIGRHFEKGTAAAPETPAAEEK